MTEQGADDHSWLAGALAGHRRTGVLIVAARDGEPRVLEANEALAAMLGRSPCELAGRPLSALATGPGRADLLRLHREAAAGRAAVGDVALARVDGGTVWVEIDAAAVLDGRPPAPRCLMLVRDVSDARAAQRAAVLLEQVAAVGRVGICEWEPGTGEAAWNDALREIVGAPPGAAPPVRDWLDLVHPDDRAEARRAVAEHVAEGELRCRIVRPHGEVRHVVVRVQQTQAASTPPRFVGFVIDVTERRLASDAHRAAEWARRRLEHQAVHDGLTGLLNRTELVRRLDAAMGAGEPVTVLFIDLDRFKLVNDVFGHAAGDDVLRLVAQRLTSIASERHVVARLGGDEFLLGLVGESASAADRIAQRVLEALREPVVLGGRSIHTTASIGIAEMDGATSSAAALLLDADVALYRAKDAGRDRRTWFDKRERDALLQRVEIEQRLRRALGADRLRLHYQSAFDLRTGRVSDVEALARWYDPDIGPISPGVFIPVAEDSGLIDQLSDWAVAEAARWCAAWLSEQEHCPTFWVNVSVRSLGRPGFDDDLRRAVADSHLDPSCFGIEITESALADNAAILASLRRISEAGIQIAIDDFGTGYSSLARLDELPIDILKIDRAFIANIETPRSLEMVAAIVDLAHAVGAATIAEGIETVGQLEALRTTRCDRASGYLLGPPAPAEALADTIGSGIEMLRQTGVASVASGAVGTG